MLPQPEAWGTSQANPAGVPGFVRIVVPAAVSERIDGKPMMMGGYLVARNPDGHGPQL